MITLDSTEAFLAYEAVRTRLPKARDDMPPPRQIETLEDIASEFDVFLLDAFGVLNIGEEPIDGVPERVAKLQAAGKRVLVVSNAASVPVTDLAQKYKRLGYAFELEDIITSRKAAIMGIGRSSDLLWGVMGLDGESMDDFGSLNWVALSDAPEAYETAQGFLLMGSGNWTPARQARLIKTLTEQPRPVLVGNPDIVAPRKDSLSAEPGHFAHAVANVTDVSPVFFGKPFHNIYDLAFQRLGDVNPRRTVMVGDSLHTDVLGAHTAGVSSVLISDYGFFAGQNVQDAIDSSGIIPDFVARRP